MFHSFKWHPHVRNQPGGVILKRAKCSVILSDTNKLLAFGSGPTTYMRNTIFAAKITGRPVRIIVPGHRHCFPVLGLAVFCKL